MNLTPGSHDLFLDIFDEAPVLDLDPGEVLIHAGAKADRVFNILNGMVMVHRTGSDGRRQILSFLVRNNFVGLTSTDDYFFTVEAVVKTRVAVCSRTALMERLANDPAVERTYLNMLHRVLEDAYDLVYSLGQRTAVERLAVFLLYLRYWHRVCENIVDDQDGRLNQVALPMGREDIADFLGLKKETVSRSFRQLEESELIHRDERSLVSIRNLAALRELAGIRDFASPRHLSADFQS
ncbi:MAG: helix-turn-helix domain-containing protein [Gammaproteobacteria bacterium]|jgi:CRP/FNR family transcriptional regulator|nr:helix-turn-helix domain-containing protein [Gammaproteobacteria bacterium]